MTYDLHHIAPMTYDLHHIAPMTYDLHHIAPIPKFILLRIEIPFQYSS